MCLAAEFGMDGIMYNDMIDVLANNQKSKQLIDRLTIHLWTIDHFPLPFIAYH
jgi:hypothetical protein